MIPDTYRAIIYDLTTTLQDTSIDWAITGSTSQALQGVSLTPNDIDVQTSEKGAFLIEERFAENVSDPVTYVESENMKSYLGELELHGISVEIIGDIQKRLNGEWESPVNVADHRKYVQMKDLQVPVLSLEYEAKAYEQLGRNERAALLREHIDT
ncbi:MAG: nucleotidyltransferase domain-containing protein [Halobacteriaceae archaeon]